RQRSVGFHTDLGFEHFGVPGVLPEAMLLRGNKPHGAADFARQNNRCVMRRSRDLGAKAAADIRNAHTYLIRLDTEKVSELASITHGRAGRQPEIKLAVDVLRQATPDMFYRMVKHRGRRVALFENAVRLAKTFVDVTPRQVVFKQEVRAALLVENRRARSESFDGIEHRRQRLILDANFFQGP